ncbi:MAG: serine hydrolase [Erythrobacter sp.]
MPRALAFALTLLLALPGSLAAQEPVPALADAPSALEERSGQVVMLLNGAAVPEDVFSREFQAAVPAAQIKALSASLVAQFGAAVAVDLLSPREGTRAVLHIRFERGLAKGSIAIEPAQENRVSELLFTSLDSLAVAGDTPERIAADLTALPGSVNAWFGPLDGGAPVISIGADAPLALGSTFKLYVLAALAEDVTAGRRKWSDVVPLTEKSYPSGRLQDWPQGAPLTLHTLASLMIAISDNTATDQLIKVLGRARILKLMRDSGHASPAANDPFLTTRELFVLKTMDPVFLDRWRAKSPDAITAAEVLMKVANPSLDAVNAAFAQGPKAIDIEWFASPADLAKLLVHMRKTADPAVFAIMAINPSATMAIKAGWNYIGFKGGSEPGVLNLTWLLTDRQGRDWMLTLGWNNPAAALDEGKLEGIAQRILLLPH